MSQPGSFPVYPAATWLPLLSAIAVILDISPMIWHFRNRNIAVTCLITWIMLLNIINFINALIWPTDNVLAWWNGVGLCDVEVKLFVGVAVALPGALARIMQALAQVMDTRRAVLVPSRAQRRRTYALDLLACFALPAFFMAAHYIVQPNRYFIFAIAGCNTTFDANWVTDVLIFMWPLILSVIDTYYGVLVIYRIYIYRSEFSRILESSNTNKSRFLRLFLMSVFLILFILPIQAYFLYQEWNSIVKVPTFGQVFIDRWIRVASGYLVFGFFGWGTDALSLYRNWLQTLGFGRLFPSLKNDSTSRLSSANSWSSLSNKAKHLFGRKSEHVEDLGSFGSLSSSAGIPPTHSKEGNRSFFQAPKRYGERTHSTPSKEVKALSPHDSTSELEPIPLSAVRSFSIVSGPTASDIDEEEAHQGPSAASQSTIPNFSQGRIRQ